MISNILIFLVKVKNQMIIIRDYVYDFQTIPDTFKMLSAIMIYTFQSGSLSVMIYSH